MWREPTSVNDEHSVAIGAEAIFLFDGGVVGVHHVLISAKSRCEHEHHAVRHVEVGDEGVGGGALIRREDELVGPSVVGLDVSVHAHGALHGAQHRSAHGAYLVAVVALGVDLVGELIGNEHLLAVEAVLGEVLDIDFAERALSDVQSEILGLDIVNLHQSHEFAAEVQSSGGSDDSALLRGEDGLVSQCVFLFGVTVDVGWQWRVAQRIEVGLELVVRSVVEETQGASSRGGVVDHLGHNRVVEPRARPTACGPG